MVQRNNHIIIAMDFGTNLACNERLEYPTLYASGKAGFCARSLEEAQSDSRPTDMMALYETIKDVVPPPEPATVAPGMPRIG